MKTVWFTHSALTTVGAHVVEVPDGTRHDFTDEELRAAGICPSTLEGDIDVPTARRLLEIVAARGGQEPE